MLSSSNINNALYVLGYKIFAQELDDVIELIPVSNFCYKNNSTCFSCKYTDKKKYLI